MNLEKLTRLLDNGEELGAAPARGCIIFHKHKEIYRHFSGFSDKENGIAYKGDELFYIFSCSKVLTCTAAMILCERNLLSLSDDVEKYIPEFKDKMVEQKDKDGNVILEPAKRKPTIYDLFCMSGGLDYSLNDAYVDDVLNRTDGKANTLEIIRGIAKRNLVIQPGSKWNYSLCHDVLAGIIEIVSGTSYKNFIAENILIPLEMNETFITAETPLENRRGTLYSYDYTANKAQLCDQNNPFIFGENYYCGGAGITTTADDYIKLAEMLCNNGKTPDGRQLISSEYIDILRRPAYDDEWQKSFNWEPGFKYAMGVYTLADPNAARFNGTAGTFGWDGAAGSYVSIDPENEISFFYMQNMFGGPIHDYRRLLLQAIYGEI